MLVDVLPGMTLAQVIVQLREAHGSSVTIRISPESSLLLTANEFRALSLAAEREQVAIAVETRDGLRRQLALLFGVPLSIPDDDETETEFSGDVGTGGEVLASEEGAVTGLPTTTIAPGQATGAASRETWETKRGISFGRLLAALTGLAALAIIGVAGYWFFLRSADVYLTPVTQQVTSTIAFSVLRPGVDDASTPGGIPSEQVTFDLSVTLDAPATGEETVGTTFAEGTLVLRNPSSQPVAIAAGTIIETFEGDSFIIGEDVTVPAASGSAGEAVVSVAASTPGANANRDAGMLSGRLDNGVYFSNRGTPVAGGAEETTTVVSQADIDALTARAEETLRSLAATSSLSGNRRVVPSTLTVQQFDTVFSAEAGAQAETLTVDATITFDALAFPTDALDADAELALAAQVPAGYELISGSVAYEAPAESGEANGAISMIVPISGESSVVITQAELDQIADDIAGESQDAAEAQLANDPRFSDARIEISPNWLPQTLPSSGGRIEVVAE